MKIIGGANKVEQADDEKTYSQKDIDSLTKQIEDGNCKIEEQKNQILRLLADFDNLKKRSAQERDEIICFSNEALIIALLPILDNFERAFAHAQEVKAAKSGDELFKGFALIKKQLEDVLIRIGLTPIETVGKQFDPFLHEAVITKDSKDKSDDTILEEMQKGYTLKGKVIRPAMVIVAKKEGGKNE